jgi:hypothetical protein
MSRSVALERDPSMSRLPVLCRARPGIVARMIFWVARRKLGHVPEPLRVLGKSNALLLGVGAFELGLERSTRVAPRVKSLAELRVALLVGCPF